MTDDQIYKLADLMAEDFDVMSRTYLFCVARQALTSFDPSNAKQTAKSGISKYFCAWSDDFNDRLTASFVKAHAKYKSDES